MWSRKSSEWETELETIRGETAKHEQASHDYAVTGSKILELAKSAHNLFIRQNSQDQARLLKTLLSNCTFDRGSLLATYRKPFDMLVEGNENGNWLGGRDSNPDNLLQRQMSYRWTTSQCRSRCTIVLKPPIIALRLAAGVASIPGAYA